MIHILGTNAPLNLLQLLLEPSRSIAKALKKATNGAYVAVLSAHTILIVAVRLAFLLAGHGGHQQLVGISADGEAVILINRYHQRGTQSQVGRQELTLIVAIEGYLGTDIRHIQAKA